MRTREKNAEYLRLYRFKKKLKNISEFKCRYCGDDAQTLHHINEKHEDTRLKNLLPVCHKCHLGIPHICDKPNFYPIVPDEAEIAPIRVKKASPRIKEAVTSKKSIDELLQDCNTYHLANITIKKPNTLSIIHITEGSKRLVNLLVSLGFTERI